MLRKRSTAFEYGIISLGTIIMAFAIFLLVKGINKLTDLRIKHEEVPAAPVSKKCPYCLSDIAIEATRCPHCTSVLTAEREEAYV